MEIYNNDPVIKKSIYTEKKNQKDKVSSPKNSSGNGTNSASPSAVPEEIRELQAKARKAILKSEAIIGGVENFRSLADESGDSRSREQLLPDVISRTVQDNEKVLEPYRGILEAYLHDNDPWPLDQLIRAENEKIELNTAEIGKHAVKEQNYISLGSTLQGQDPEALLKAVIQQLKEQGEPEINIPRNRVLDLLGE